MNLSVEDFLIKAYNKKASDLHLTVHSLPIYRINGRLITQGEIKFSRKQTEKMAMSLMNDGEWEQFIKEKEIDFSYEIPTIARFRVNVFFQKNNISLAIRIIPNEIPTIQELYLPEILQELVLKPQGLILVTGPTGSGKSTTLAAMIDYINTHKAKHVITLEDPIEFIHDHNRSVIHQRELGSDTNSFSRGLRSALRQDPDVILVGELRDLDTIATAITAAETGHLVLATLHTNSASETIHRLIDVFPAHQQSQIRIQLAGILEAILSQRLLHHKNQSRRVVATELLLNASSVANLIRNKKIEQIKNIMQTSRKLGMHTLEMSIQNLIQRGEITKKEGMPYLLGAGES